MRTTMEEGRSGGVKYSPITTSFLLERGSENREGGKSGLLQMTSHVELHRVRLGPTLVISHSPMSIL